jgi:hypothetical protein
VLDPSQKTREVFRTSPAWVRWTEPKGLISAQLAFQPIVGPWSRKTPFLFCFNFQKMFWTFKN